MLSSLNILVLNYLNTTAGSGTSFALGAYDLTTSFQNIWTKAGSGVYDDNIITYKAKIVDNVLTIRVEYYDGDPRPGIEPGTSGVDEQVNGIITSIFEQQRANASVVINTPAYVTRRELS
jgi:hypothetical protein